MTTEPLTFRAYADGALVCAHRDSSVCPGCAMHPHIVEIMGAHFYICQTNTEKWKQLAQDWTR